MDIKHAGSIFSILALAHVAFTEAAAAQQAPTPTPTPRPASCLLRFASDDLVARNYASFDAAGSTYRLSKDGKILTVSRSLGSTRVLRQYDFGAMSFKERSYGDSRYVGDAADCLNLCQVDARDAQEAVQWISHHLHAFNPTYIAGALNTLQGYVKLMPGTGFTVNAFRNGLIVGSLSYKNYARCGGKTEEITATSYIGDESVTLDLASKTFTWRMSRQGNDYEKVIGASDLKLMNDAMQAYLLAHVQGMKVNLSKNVAVGAAYNHENQALDMVQQKLSAFVPDGKPGPWGYSVPYLPGSSAKYLENKQPAVFWPNMPVDVAEARHWPAK